MPRFLFFRFKRFLSSLYESSKGADVPFNEVERLKIRIPRTLDQGLSDAIASHLVLALASPSRLTYLLSILQDLYQIDNADCCVGDPVTSFSGLQNVSLTNLIRSFVLKLDQIQYFLCPPLVVVLIGVDAFRTLFAERLCGHLAASNLRRYVAFSRAYAVCTTLGGAFATLRVRKEALFYATILLYLAIHSNDRPLEMRARLYQLLAAPVVRGREAKARWNKKVSELEFLAEKSGRSELSNIAKYIRQQRKDMQISAEL